MRHSHPLLILLGLICSLAHASFNFPQPKLKLHNHNFLDLSRHGRHLLEQLHSVDISHLTLPLPDGSWVNITLTQNSRLVSAEFSETVVSGDGAIRDTTGSSKVTGCHYFGGFQRKGKWVSKGAAVSICHEISAVVYVDKEVLHFGYEFGGEHTTVRRLEGSETAVDYVVKPEYKVMNIPGNSGGSMGGMGISSVQPASLASELFLELLIVNDMERVAQFEDLSALTADTLSVLNQVALFYSSSVFVSASITLVVSGMVHANTSFLGVPSVQGEHNASQVLGNLTDWRRLHIDSLPAHDTAHLFSGKEFMGPTIGLAYTDSICDQTDACSVIPHGYCYKPTEVGDLSCCLRWSAGISEVHRTNVESFDAATVAHELGHLLGFPHDGGDGASSCSSSGFLMSPVSVSNADQTDAEWSSCSGSIFESRYAQAADTNGYHPYSCLSNNPLPPSASTSAPSAEPTTASQLTLQPTAQTSSAPNVINAAAQRQVAYLVITWVFIFRSLYV